MIPHPYSITNNLCTLLANWLNSTTVCTSPQYSSGYLRVQHDNSISIPAVADTPMYHTIEASCLLDPDLLNLASGASLLPSFPLALPFFRSNSRWAHMFAGCSSYIGSRRQLGGSEGAGNRRESSKTMPVYPSRGNEIYINFCSRRENNRRQRRSVLVVPVSLSVSPSLFLFVSLLASTTTVNHPKTRLQRSRFECYSLSLIRSNRALPSTELSIKWEFVFLEGLLCLDFARSRLSFGKKCVVDEIVIRNEK